MSTYIPAGKHLSSGEWTEILDAVRVRFPPPRYRVARMYSNISVAVYDNDKPGEHPQVVRV